jgi:hypothetical protein
MTTDLMTIPNSLQMVPLSVLLSNSRMNADQSLNHTNLCKAIQFKSH